MATANTYTLYSQSALERILGIKRQAIKKMEVWAYVVFIIIEGKRPRFYSKRPFLALFGSMRKEKGQKLQVVDFGGTIFRVKSGGVSSKKVEGVDSYKVSLWSQRIICECRDFREQLEIPKGDQFPPEKKAFQRPICKHGYAVLGYLGFDSLKDYVEKTNHIDWIEIADNGAIRRAVEFAAAF